MSDDEIIAVVQAHKEGKRIEACDAGKAEYWTECKYPGWNFYDFLFRVAPEPRKPREWCVPLSFFNWSTTGVGGEYVRVREVIQ